MITENQQKQTMHAVHNFPQFQAISTPETKVRYNIFSVILAIINIKWHDKHILAKNITRSTTKNEFKYF